VEATGNFVACCVACCFDIVAGVDGALHPFSDYDVCNTVDQNV